MLKVSPLKGFIRFGKKGKLSPRYIEPFKILVKVREIAYQLQLPLELSRVHDAFHVSNHKKGYSDEKLKVPLDEIRVNEKPHFRKEPMEVIDKEVKRTKRNRIHLILKSLS
jgi:hypothetical protein